MHSIKEIMQNKSQQILSGTPANQDLNQKSQTTSSPSTITEKERKRIDKLFLQFAARYGQVWRSQFKSDAFLAFAKNEWAEGLSMFNDKQLDEAMELYKKKEFPPTLSQLTSLCKALKNRHNVFQSEEKGKSTPEVAQRHMNHIREKLGMPKRALSR